MVRSPFSIRHLAAVGTCLCLLLGTGAGAAQARTAGILPPRNPVSDCSGYASAGASDLAAINACRAQEGVGPLRLPSNWNSLTPVEQGFVLIDLERVNRGLRPIVGLSSSLDQLASEGAAQSTDPSFPSGNFLGGGAIWAGAPSVLTADYLWMYDDGPNGSNLDCTSAGASGCWGHRDIILWDRSGGPLVAGGGYAGGGGNGSYAYLLLSGYSTANLTFTWAAELRHFAKPPTVEPTGNAARAAVRRHRKHKHRRRHSQRRRHRRTHRRRHTRPGRTRSTGAGAGSVLTITFG